jgi:putative tricarboxylic transport membrane protein
VVAPRQPIVRVNEEAGLMSKGTGVRVLAVLAAFGLLTAACGDGGGGGGGSAKQISGLEILVGTAPGGGFDQTARTAAQVMEDANLARNVQVQNIPGAGNTVALQRLVNKKGDGKVIQMMGLGLVGGVYTNKSKATLDDTTPIARLTQDSEVVVVKQDSPYKDLKSLVDAWKANPGKLPVGGGSSPGGPDHLAPMLMAKAVGLEPKQVNYVSYEGGGELLAALLGGEIAFGVTGPSEVTDQIKAGKARALGVTSAERVPSVDAPTLKEAGVDLEFTNWRGWVAPGGLSDDDKQALLDLADKMHASQGWKDAVAKNGWIDAYLAGEEYASFLKAEDQRVGDVLTSLGL